MSNEERFSINKQISQGPDKPDESICYFILHLLYLIVIDMSNVEPDLYIQEPDKSDKSICYFIYCVIMFILYLLNIRPYFAVEYSPIFNPSIFFFIIAHAQTIVRMRNDNYCLCYYGCDPFDAVFLRFAKIIFS